METKYDVIIIGAGIGGLVCGCYLAKAGLKVLIVEKHYKAGGYCTSFERNGYIFDSGPHYIGSLREDGILSQILYELGIIDEIEWIRPEISDTIRIKDDIFYLYSDYKRLIDDLSSRFYKEKDSIKEFFSFIRERNILNIGIKLRFTSFRELLDKYFKDERIKNVLTVPLASIGLNSFCASAVVASVLYKEFVLDGGYYPKEGMQSLADVLVKKFVSFGGNICFKKEAKEVILEGNKCKGVICEGDDYYLGDFIVANCSIFHLWRVLLSNKVDNKKLNNIQPSISAFVVFLVVENLLGWDKKNSGMLWYFDDYEVDRYYQREARKVLELEVLPYLIVNFTSMYNIHNERFLNDNKLILRLFLGAEYMGEDYWEKYRRNIEEKCLKKLSDIFGIDIKNKIYFLFNATPLTFYNYTYNYKGALFGIESLPTQIDMDVLPFKVSEVKNLLLCGHWTTTGLGHSGVAMVGYIGRYVAGHIINSLGKRK